MVREEIQDESQITEDAVEYRSLRRNFMLCQLVTDAVIRGISLPKRRTFLVMDMEPLSLLRRSTSSFK